MLVSDHCLPTSDHFRRGVHPGPCEVRVPDEVTGKDLLHHVRSPELALEKRGYVPKNNYGNYGFIAVHRKVRRATQRNQYPKWYQIM